jgi:hypothetical protein
LGAKPACHIFLAPCTEEVKERSFFGVIFVIICWFLAEESGIEKKESRDDEKSEKCVGDYFF